MRRAKKGTVVAQMSGAVAYDLITGINTSTDADVAANAGRISLTIQNAGTSAIIVGFTAVGQANGLVLAAGTANDDGLGGSITIDNYQGDVFLYDSGGAGRARYVEVSAS